MENNIFLGFLNVSWSNGATECISICQSGTPHSTCTILTPISEIEIFVLSIDFSSGIRCEVSIAPFGDLTVE